MREEIKKIIKAFYIFADDELRFGRRQLDVGDGCRIEKAVSDILGIIEKDYVKLSDCEIDVSLIEKIIFDAYPIKHQYQVLLATSEFKKWCNEIAEALNRAGIVKERKPE